MDVGAPDEQDLPESQTGTPASAIDPAEFAALKAEAEEYRSIKPWLENARPYAEDIDRFISDESAREVAKTAWKGYEAIKADQAEQVPGWAKTLTEKAESATKYIEEQRTRDEQRKTFESLGSQIVDIGRKHPALAQDNYKFVADTIAAVNARPGDYPFIRNYDQLITYVAAAAPYLTTADTDKPSAKREEARQMLKAQKAPTSLRGDASVPGLATTPESVKLDRKGVHKYLKDKLAAGRG